MDCLHTLEGGAGWAVDYLYQMIGDTVYPYVKELLQFGVRVLSYVPNTVRSIASSVVHFVTCTFSRILLLT